MNNRRKLGELVDDIAMGPFGSNLKADNFISSGVPVIRGGNLNEGGFDDKNFVFVSEEKALSLKRSLAFPNDLVFTHRGTIGQVGLIKKGKYPYYLVSQSQVKLSVNKNFLDPKFLFYWFKSPIGQYELLKNSAQVGVPSIASPTKSLKEIDISIPPLPTQKAIAEILSSLDDKIELNNQINQNLEALAQSIFKQWFVDFEFPNENGEPYKSSGGEMVDSELGEIPKGWRLAALSEIIEFNPTEKLEKGKTSSYLDMSSLPTIGSFPNLPIQREFTSGMKFRNGDSLFARITPCLENGKTAFVQFLEENEIGWGSTEFIVLRPKTNWPKEVGYLIARNENFRSFAIQNLVGTSGRQRVSSSILEGFQMAIPNNSTIPDQFGAIVFDFFEMIKANSLENILLKELRDTLLPRLISGELEVSQFELEAHG